MAELVLLSALGLVSLRPPEKLIAWLSKFFRKVWRELPAAAVKKIAELIVQLIWIGIVYAVLVVAGVRITIGTGT